MELPLRYSELTLRQLTVLHTTDNALERLHEITGKTYEELRKMPFTEIERHNEHLDLLLQAETFSKQDIITLNGIDYGFIPDWENFTTGEWVDMEVLCADFWNNATKIMSVLYRPISKKWGDVYEIEEYTAKEDNKPFNAMSAEDFSGCMLFFLNTKKELLHTLKSSLIATATVAMSSAKNGDGIRSSTDLPMRTYSKLTQLLNSLYRWCFRTLHSSKT